MVGRARGEGHRGAAWGPPTTSSCCGRPQLRRRMLRPRLGSGGAPGGLGLGGAAAKAGGGGRPEPRLPASARRAPRAGGCSQAALPLPPPAHVHLKAPSVAGAGSFIAAAVVSQAPPPRSSPARSQPQAHAYLSSPPARPGSSRGGSTLPGSVGSCPRMGAAAAPRQPARSTCCRSPAGPARGGCGWARCCWVRVPPGGSRGPCPLRCGGGAQPHVGGARELPCPGGGRTWGAAGQDQSLQVEPTPGLPPLPRSPAKSILWLLMGLRGGN